MITQWLELFPVSKFDLLDTYFVIPAFSITGIQTAGINDSYILRQYNVTFDYNVSLKKLERPADVTDFILCVKYRIGEAVTRYKLWEGLGEKMWEYIPSYSGQVLRGNMVFEVWSVVGSPTATLSNDLAIYTTLRRVPSSMEDYDDSVNSVLSPAQGIFNVTGVYPFDNSAQAHLSN